MFAGLIGKLALGALWSKARTNAAHDWQAIPPRARLWVIGIAAALILVLVHQWYAHRELKAQYKAGYAQAIADINTRAAKQITALKQVKTAGDAKNVATNEGVKKTHDAQTAHIAGNLADLLGVLDRSQGRGGGVAGRGVPDAAGGSGAGRTASSADDGLAQDAPARVGDVLIAVPARGLYTRAAQCDRDYAALTAWEDAYQGWRQNYQDWLAKSNAVKP